MPSGVYPRKPFMRSVRVSLKKRGAILQALEKGLGVSRIAREFGVGLATVKRIRSAHAIQTTDLSVTQ